MTKYLRWTPDRLELIADLARLGTTDADIGDRFGVSGATIHAVRRHHGIPTNSKRGYRKPVARPETPEEPALPVVNGVTQCPTRYAGGICAGPTARPKSRR